MIEKLTDKTIKMMLDFITAEKKPEGFVEQDDDRYILSYKIKSVNGLLHSGSYGSCDDYMDKFKQIILQAINYDIHH